MSSSTARRNDDERQPLISRGDELNEKGHYNLAGLSTRHFWTLVRFQCLHIFDKFLDERRLINQLLSIWTAAFLSAFDTTVGKPPHPLVVHLPLIKARSKTRLIPFSRYALGIHFVRFQRSEHGLMARNGVVSFTLLGLRGYKLIRNSLLSVCCFTPIYGRLCNIIGRQASLLIALSFFGTPSSSPV